MFQGIRLAKSTLPFGRLKRISSSIGRLDFLNGAHDRPDEENGQNGREGEGKANPRRGLVPHHGHTDERRIRDDLTQGRGQAEFVKAGGAQLGFMLENEGIDEEVNGLKRQGRCDDGKGNLSNGVVISGLFNPLEQQESRVRTEQRCHDGPAFVLGGGSAFNVHRAVTHGSARKQWGYDVSLH